MKIKNPLFEWRGPAPFYFVEIDDDRSAQIKKVSKDFTYGWGVLYATIESGSKIWTTSLIPKEGRYLIPFKDAIRKELGVVVGDIIECNVTLGKRAQQ